MQAWEHRTAASIVDLAARIRVADWEDAQEWCNFALLRPDSAAVGARVGTLRPEAPPGIHADRTGRFCHGLSNRASYRCEVVGRNARGHLKQFLYDLGPPAWDHPLFWLSGQIEPICVGEGIAWMGRSPSGTQAASMAVDHTLVELDVVEGCFQREEIEEFFSSLRPVSPVAQERVRKTPLALLCYQRRHPDLLITVPMGYWEHRRRPPALLTTPLTSEEALPALAELPLPILAGYTLDSAILFGDVGDPQEIDLVYRRGTAPEHWIRLLIWTAGADGSLAFPPKIDRQPCRHHAIRLNGSTVWHAWLTLEYGQHEAVWRDATRV